MFVNCSSSQEGLVTVWKELFLSHDIMGCPVYSGTTVLRDSFWVVFYGCLLLLWSELSREFWHTYMPELFIPRYKSVSIVKQVPLVPLLCQLVPSSPLFSSLDLEMVLLALRLHTHLVIKHAFCCVRHFNVLLLSQYTRIRHLSTQLRQVHLW